jgi:hypothetical protein
MLEEMPNYAAPFFFWHAFKVIIIVSEGREGEWFEGREGERESRQHQEEDVFPDVMLMCYVMLKAIPSFSASLPVNSHQVR